MNFLTPQRKGLRGETSAVKRDTEGRIPLGQISIDQEKHKQSGFANLSIISTAQKTNTSDSSAQRTGLRIRGHNDEEEDEEEKNVFSPDFELDGLEENDLSDSDSDLGFEDKENVDPLTCLSEEVEAKMMRKEEFESPLRDADYRPFTHLNLEDSFEKEIADKMALNERAPLGDITPASVQRKKKLQKKRTAEPTTEERILCCRALKDRMVFRAEESSHPYGLLSPEIGLSEDKREFAVDSFSHSPVLR